MAKTLLNWAGIGTDFFDSSSLTARYFALVGGYRSAGNGSADVAVRMQAKVGVAGSLSGLRARVTTNEFTASTTIGSYINTAAGAVLVSVPAATTGTFSDTTHSDAIAAGDLACWRIGPLSTLKHFVAPQVSCAFDATASPAVLMDSTDTGATTFNGGTASATRYAPLAGIGDNANGYFVTTEANAQTSLSAAGTIRRLGLYIISNTSTNAMSATLRINGLDATSTIAIGATSTGYIEDTTHTDAVAAGALVGVKTVSGAGTVNASVAFIAATFTSSATNWSNRAASTRTVTQTFSTTANSFIPIAGALTNSAAVLTSESLAQSVAPFAHYLDRLTCRVALFSGGAVAAPVRTRINGADGAGVLSIPAATTGTFEDTTHYDTIAAGDAICYRVGAIGAGASMAMTYIGTRGDTTNPAPVATARRRTSARW